MRHFGLLGDSLQGGGEMGRQGQLGRTLVACVLVAAWIVPFYPSSLAQVGMRAPDGYRLGLVKQFEETSYYLRDVDFIRDDVGWAVGQPHWDAAAKDHKGTILKTGDGGRSWVALWNIPSVALNAVDFVDDDKGWAVGAGGAVLHTYNGGEDWVLRTVPLSGDLRGVSFVSTTHGWATSVRPIHYHSSGEPDNWQAGVWHTADGGENWLPQILPTGASILNDVIFTDALHGWAVGAKCVGHDAQGNPQHGAAIYYTADGGSTWAEQACGGEDLDVRLTAVDAVDAQHAWAVGFSAAAPVSGGVVLRTTNGGAQWERQELGGSGDVLWDVECVDTERGYVVGANATSTWGPPVWRTLDGGEHWQKVRLAQHENDGLYGLSVVNSQALAVGDHDYVVRSTRAWDSCDVFIPEEPCLDCECLFEAAFVSTHYDFEDVFFSDAYHGWAVGRYSEGPQLTGQVILHTADGGQHWATQHRKAPPLDALSSAFGLNAVQFVDGQTGWAVGTSAQQHDAILHTTDGGQHWVEQGQELYGSQECEFFGLHFLGGQEGWALSSSRFLSDTIFLAHTTDGGQHWQWVDSGLEGPIVASTGPVQGDVAFCDAQYGWAVGGLGVVIHTADGGTTWSRQALSCGCPTCPLRLYALYVLDRMEGWIAGEGLYHTTNGGETWDAQSTAATGDFHDLQFVDASHGWLAGEDGTILYTEDGGALWRTLDNQVSDHTLNGLWFVRAQQGWFVGDHGTILATAQTPSWLAYLPLLRR
jgi:photosystem II stability/assembly factor-like uncharacterized protein